MPPKKRTPGKAAQRFLVNRVIDGDTVELGNGRGVRLLGIDTPERGDCGFDTATDDLVKLVEGKPVRLTKPGDTDRYGRLLRYLNIGDMDAGLRLIKNGLRSLATTPVTATATIPASPATSPPTRPANKEVRPAAAAEPARPEEASGNCASGYSPVPSYPPDVNCADVNGPINVSGTDPHGLDADGDGTACES